ncbi:AraC family transcriptional regulator [Parasphaerochaeta coccoides]|nr:helix-turn-helix domain-containing protein [Parasphaerochaeta coccoides]
MHLFETATQKQLLSYGQIALDSDVLYINTITNSVKDIFDSISFDSQISKLLNYESIQASDLYLGLQRLRTYADSNVFIDSIYIYNRSDDTIYVSSPNALEAVYSPSDFYDEGASDLMEHYSAYKNMQPIFRRIEVTYPDESVSSYVSFIRYNTLKPTNHSDVVMINVKLDIFSQLLSSVPENNNRLLLFADSAGWYEVIAGSRASYSEHTIETVLQKLNEGSFDIRLEDKHYIVCSQRVMSSAIHIVLIADESTMSTITQAKGYSHSLMLLALLFAVCIIATISVIKRIIRINALHKSTMANLQKEKLELSFENKRRQILVYFHGNSSEEISDNDMADLCGLIGHENNASLRTVLILLSINSYHSKISLRYERVKDRNVLKYDICKTAEEVMSGFQVVCSTFDDNENCFFVVQKMEDQCGLIEALANVSNFIKEKYSVTATIFVSADTEFSKLPSSYAELSKHLPYKTLYEPGSIITSDMLDAREMFTCSIPDVLSRRLSQNILQLNVAMAILDLKEILEIISKGSYKSFQLNLFQLVVDLDDVLSKLQVNNGIEKTIYIDVLLYNLTSFETLDSIYKAFEAVILQAEQIVMQNKNSHQANIITQMQDIIRNNYFMKDFSIVIVSEQIGMNASYLGKLFKRSTGLTFIEFLHEERMAAACNLLETTDMKIVEIVSTVGYSDVPYFYKLFKKVNGCTPMSYRQKH